ncbi:MAG: hypothetical protein U0575_15485 [Phycisphaerales bacterium]
MIRHVLVSVRTDRLRGRVSAVNSVFIECSKNRCSADSRRAGGDLVPAPSPALAVSGGVGTLLVVIATAAFVPELRRLGRIGAGDEESPR